MFTCIKYVMIIPRNISKLELEQRNKEINSIDMGVSNRDLKQLYFGSGQRVCAPGALSCRQQHSSSTHPDEAE